MFDKEGFGAALAQRLLFAATGTSLAVMGCSNTPESNKVPDQEGSTSAVASASASTTPVSAQLPSAPMAPASSPALSGSTPSSKPVDFQRQCGAGNKGSEYCFEPHSVMRSKGTGEPAPKLPASAYDSNGCLANKDVTSGCCEGAIAGPKFENGKCCYGFCDRVCCGRPFYVGDESRVAGWVDGDDWVTSDRALGDAFGVDPKRAAAAEVWLADALLEHASIASFSRFTLQLLALGAPADLVRDACAAGLDEVRHAELCFEVAARFAGRPYGPAALPMVGVTLDEVRLEDAIHSTIVEGCVGETIAAVTAAERCARAQEPVARAALARIAEDEARHAELSWRFLRWALRTGGASALAAARRAFAEVRSSPGCEGAPIVSELHGYGVLSPSEQAGIARDARRMIEEIAREVLVPARRDRHAGITFAQSPTAPG